MIEGNYVTLFYCQVHMVCFSDEMPLTTSVIVLKYSVAMTTTTQANKVSIIMRTKDRAILLKRALESVASQTYTNYCLVIVNDGGDSVQLEKIINKYRSKISGNVMLIHIQKSLGKWHAANQGVKKSQSTYIVLHDDDDSWEPNFLQKTTDFLEDSKHINYAGVATFTNLITEQITSSGVKQLSSSRFAPGLDQISIYELCRHNIFPPISYLYRRLIHDTTGLYNESLDALADWEFNLNTIRKYDIAMIHEKLANWHIRSKTSDTPSALQNVTQPNSSSYTDNYTILLNSILRNDLKKGRFDIGFLVNLLYNSREQEEKQRQYFDHRVSALTELIIKNQNDINSLSAQVAQTQQSVERINRMPKELLKRTVALPITVSRKIKHKLNNRN